MADPYSRLVYTTDPSRNKKCPRCKNLIEECACIPDEKWDPSTIVAVLRVEKQGRSGKMVTVIRGFPRNEGRIKELTKMLKNRCGSGGTYRIDADSARIEIQGDQRVAIRTFLEKQKMNVRG